MNVGNVRLYVNPWAASAEVGAFERFHTCRLENDRFVKYPAGIDVADVLDLPNDWPGER